MGGTGGGVFAFDRALGYPVRFFHPRSPLTPATDMTSDSSTTPAPEGDAAAPVLFTDLALPEPLLSALAEDGYTEPSPIQAAIIPYLLDGRDVIGQAQTGTGKTAAFALPILAQLAADAEAGHKHPKGPAALVLTPTRELAIQVADAFAKYARNLRGVKVLAVYGGADFRGQAIPLNRGVDVVVGTPGRVMDHMRRGTLDVSNIRTLVLDEADEMLRMGFVDDVEWVLSETPDGRQVALFSATMPNVIKTIAEKQLSNPERISIQGISKTADTVRQRYWRAQGVRKIDALCRLLAVEPVDAALVFVRTRMATSELARALQDAGIPAAPLSGDVPQNQRERTIEALRKGRLKIVVATDVAARGIDVKSITHVFNYDVPEDTEAYIHRIGRTGRAGRTGEAILFVENRQRHHLRNIERATGRPIEKMELPTEADVHAIQLERFGDQFKKRLARKDGSAEPAALRSFIEEICEETGRDALDVAAYLVGPAMSAVAGGGNTASSSFQETPGQGSKGQGSFGGNTSGGASRGRPDRGERPAARAPMGGASEIYRVAVGRTDGVRAGHLVGAIANETGLDGQDIGGIRIFDSYCTVELPAGMPKNVFEMLQRTTVLGKPLRIRRADDRSEVGPQNKRPHRPSAPPRPAPENHHSGNHHAAGHRAASGASASGGGYPRKPFGATAHATAASASASATPIPADEKPRFKVKFVPQTPAAGKAKAASKPKAKVKGKFKPKGKFNASASAEGKPFKKFKAAAKPKPGGGKANKPGGGVKPRSAGKAKKDGPHSLAPAPFSGGRGKPVRLNKRPR